MTIPKTMKAVRVWPAGLSRGEGEAAILSTRAFSFPQNSSDNINYLQSPPLRSSDNPVIMYL